MTKDVLLVIPAYNEAKSIAGVIEDILSFYTEILVVDDGSSDDTLSILKKLPVKVLALENNQGKAAALYNGIAYAKSHGYKAVMSMDADGQHEAKYIPTMLKQHQVHPECIIIAARINNIEAAPKHRHFANCFADFWVSWAAGCPIFDSQCGFRLVPLAVFDKITIAYDKSRSFVFESEMIIRAARKGFGFCFVAIAKRYDERMRESYFHPVKDITKIVLMVAWQLIKGFMCIPGLLRYILGRKKAKANIVR